MRSLLAVLILLAFTSSAGAAIDPSLTARGEAAAVETWGPLACPSITYVSKTTAEMPMNDYGPSGGYVISSTPCTVFLDEAVFVALTSDQQCGLVEHEIGHLQGFEHTEEPGIMNRTGVGQLQGSCKSRPVVVDPRRADGKARNQDRRSDRKWCRRNAKVCVANYQLLSLRSLSREAYMAATLP